MDSQLVSALPPIAYPNVNEANFSDKTELDRLLELIKRHEETIRTVKPERAAAQAKGCACQQSINRKHTIVSWYTDLIGVAMLPNSPRAPDSVDYLL